MALIVGRKSVLEALLSEKKLQKIYLQFGQRGKVIDEIRVLAKKQSVIVQEVPIEKFKKLTSAEHSQGIAALESSESLIDSQKLLLYSKAHTQLLVALDMVQDTQNVGAIIRTVACAGADGVVVTKHNSAPINDTVSKISAGGLQAIKVSQVVNLAQFIESAKKEGFFVIGAELNPKAKPYTKVDYTGPILIVVGNEEAGIRQLTSKNCDELVYIPMPGKLQSLNVSVATGILLYEALKQRHKH